MSKLEEMENFVKVVESGSITKAADILDIAKSAVSRRLTELEARLGVQLFIRTTRKLTLTDTGRSFYDRCLRILADVEETEALVSQAHGALRGRLKLALPWVFGHLHLTAVLNDFMQLHPDLQLEIDFSDRRVDIVQEGFDAALRIGRLEDSSLVARQITPIRSIACASPNFVEQQGLPPSPKALSDWPALHYSHLANRQLSFETGGSDKSGYVTLNPCLEANSGEFLKAACIAGKGVLVTPTFIVHDELERGRLVPVLPDVNWGSVNAYVLYPHTRHLSAKVRAFTDFLVERFAGVPPWDCWLFKQGYIR